MGQEEISERDQLKLTALAFIVTAALVLGGYYLYEHSIEIKQIGRQQIVLSRKTILHYEEVEEKLEKIEKTVSHMAKRISEIEKGKR